MSVPDSFSVLLIHNFIAEIHLNLKRSKYDNGLWFKKNEIRQNVFTKKPFLGIYKFFAKKG